MKHPVVGHERVRSLLERYLPPVTLLRGLESIGKWTLACHLIDHHSVDVFDRYYISGSFSVPDSHDLLSWAYRPPHGRFKVAAVNLDGATQMSFHLLLKTVEEPPPGVRFLFTSSGHLPDTFVSRCIVHALAPLAPEQLRQVLLAQGMSKPVAERQSAASRGQVAPALARTSDAQYEILFGVLKALAARDTAAFNKAFTDFGVATRDLLHRWLVEALTGKRILFTDEEMFGFDRNRPLLMAMMRRLSMAPATSARLQVRVALEPFLGN